jgi:hypothetical protein
MSKRKTNLNNSVAFQLMSATGNKGFEITRDTTKAKGSRANESVVIEYVSEIGSSVGFDFDCSDPCFTEEQLQAMTAHFCK